MEINLGNVLTALSVLVGMATLAFGLVKWVQAQVKEVRAEARAECVRLDGKVDLVRGECARREDLHALAGDLHVIPGVVSGVLGNDALKADAIHPNRAGYTRLADAAAAVLQRCR